MNKPIYVVGGSKGGVGKSLVTMALVHFLKENDDEVFLIDADTSNPDVLKSYEEEVTCKLVNLDDADGWIQFVNVCDEHRELRGRRQHGGAQQRGGRAIWRDPQQIARRVAKEFGDLVGHQPPT